MSTTTNQKYKFTPQEREQFESLSDLYSIIIAAEQLERAYLKSSITPQEYTPMMLTLISQFKTLSGLLQLSVKSFMSQYDMNCPAAYKRLVEIGVPATIEHSVEAPATFGQKNKVIAETVQFFITLMDSLKLNVTAVDEVHPQLSDLMQTLNKVQNYKGEGKTKIKEWLITLNQMKASDELDATQVRQLLFDMESAYAEFQHSLE